MNKYTVVEMEQVMWGAALLGSGGGGGIALAQSFLAGLPEGAFIYVIDQSELQDRRCSIVAFLGAPSAGSQPDPTALLAAYDLLGGTACVIPGEIGPVNSLSPMFVAMARPGVVVANGDGAGRALPKISMATFNNKNMTPSMAISNGKGIDISIDTQVPIGSADSILRAIVSDRASFGQVGGLALWSMDAPTANAATIWGTLESTRQLGAAILSNLTVAQLKDKLGALGWPVDETFTGTLAVGSTLTAGGFDVGSVSVTSADGVVQTLFTENESMVRWFSTSQRGIPAPYSLCYWDNESQRPFTNVEAARYAGKQVTILCLQPRAQLMHQSYAMQGFTDFLVSFGYAGKIPNLSATTAVR